MKTLTAALCILALGCASSEPDVSSDESSSSESSAQSESVPAAVPKTAADKPDAIAGIPVAFSEDVNRETQKCYQITGSLAYDPSRDFPLAIIKLHYIRKHDAREFIVNQTVFIGGVYVRDVTSVNEIPKDLTIHEAVLDSSMGFLMPMEGGNGELGTVFYSLPTI